MIRRLGPGDAGWLNKLANDPSVRPSIGGFFDRLDWSPFLDDPNVYALYGHFGGVLYVPIMPGLYDCHMQVLSGARGKWALRTARETFWYMFTKTDAMELIARIPEYNKAARGMMRLIGAHPERVQERAWIKDGEVCSVTWYSLTIHDWMRQCDSNWVSVCTAEYEPKRSVFLTRMKLMTAHIEGD